MHKTWVEIDAESLRHNIRSIRAAIGNGRGIVLIVKSDAYGHGAQSVGKIASEEGVDRFAVAAVKEGIELREADITGEILLLHPPLDFETDTCIQAGLSPTVSSVANARLISDRADFGSVGVHVEINTGINRLGLDWQAAASEVQQIASLPHIDIRGVFTHFRGIDPSDSSSIDQQLQRFEKVVQAVRDAGIDPGLVHAASSHALSRFAQSHLGAVRPGMIIYAGLDPKSPITESTNGAASHMQSMTGVMSVYSHVLHCRRVEAGEWIHYGETFQAPRPMDVAVVPIGYGMGYSRHFSNNADMLIHGRRAPIVGVVGMDMTVVDVATIPDVAVGDRVTIMGRDGSKHISAFELAERSGTIPYEVVCRLGNGLPRVLVNANESAARAQSAQVAVTESAHR
ncbi:MAG: alanine racemase [candidate division Zixibacteria bacterium]|nr:alanine racemase [candidate division Zixibacteria bacterium]